MLVPSLPPPIIVAHATSYSSVMVTWKAIPEDHTNGILLGYVVKLEGIDDRFYGCSKTVEIQGLEKSKVYKIKVAGYTSKGYGNFSEDVLSITNIDGRSIHKPVRASCIVLTVLMVIVSLTTVFYRKNVSFCAA